MYQQVKKQYVINVLVMDFKYMFMKIKIILVIIISFISFDAFSQIEKPCLFIGQYDIQKKGICSDRVWVHEGVNDAKDYELRRKQFLLEHKTENAITRIVNSNQGVVIYEFQKKVSGWVCTPTVQNIVISKTIEKSKKEFDTYLTNNPKDFNTQPKIIFTWQGKMR